MKAGALFDWVEWCDSKYIILMSDWDANRYWTAWSSSSGAPTKAKEAATQLKNQWIVIYSIWYDVNATAKNTLMAIAQDDDHYYAATTTNIFEVFQNIRNVAELNAWEPSNIEDPVWWAVIDTIWDITIPAWSQIIDPGTVYSFQIKIRPDMTDWQASNSWLTLTYKDVNGDSQDLSIAPENTAEIYWELPKCEGEYPTWIAVVTWSDEFTQVWNWDVLEPETKEWTYVDSDTPWECEWTCAAGYVWSGSVCVIPKFHVTFDPNGWTPTPEPVDVESWWTIPAPVDPTKTWYHLSWWTVNCDGEKFVFPGVVTWDITLCAKWEPNEYTIVFSWNGGNGIMSNQTLTYDDTKNLNPNLYTKEWSSFVRWNTSPDWNGTSYENEQSVKNLTTTWKVMLYAQWSENLYTIVFSWNGWQWTMANQTLSYNESKALDANSFTKTWYYFSWWNTEVDNSGTGYVDKQTVKNLANSWSVTLFAQWKPNKYTINFSWNKATSWTTPDLSLDYDTTWTLPSNWYGKIWYQFSGWNTKPDWTWTWYVNQATVKNLATTWTVTLYAQWNPNKYTIVFSWNKATSGSMESQQMTYDVSGTLNPNQFWREWFNFVEWNTKSDGSWTWYANGALVKNLLTTGSLTLYAQWSANTYEVEFVKNGATTWVMLNQTFPYDTTKKLTPNAFEKEWYHFTWWNTKADKTWTWYEDEAEVKNLATTWVVKMYAQWEPNKYVIIFDWNGASAWTMSWLEMVYDQEKALTMNSYSRNWYKYIWWNTQPDWKWVSYTDGQVVKNLLTGWEVRLYAQWQKLWSSWGWGGWWGCVKDDCPDGDYSWDRCDKKCWTPPSQEKTGEKQPEPKPEPTPKPTPIPPSKKCSIAGSTHSAEVNEAYIWACERWIIDSNTIQGAKLWEFLNRAEMAKITTIFEIRELDAKPNVNKDCSAFADSMTWYGQQMKNYMVTSCQLERMWIHTADHKAIPDFMPRKFVSRAEFWTILSRILWEDRYEAEKNSRYYYVEHLNKLKEAWILTNIDPTLVERRSYAILMIYRAAKMLWKI